MKQSEILVLKIIKKVKAMIFTQTAERDNRIVVLSQYQSTRLIKKGQTTSYYVAKCLSNRNDPTLVDTKCFIKQIIITITTNEDLEKYKQLYKNEIQVHHQIEREIYSSTKYFSKLLDYWYENNQIFAKFTIVTKYELFGDLNHFLQYVKQQKIQLLEKEVIYILNSMLRASLELHKIKIIHRDIKPQNIFIDQFFQIKFGDFGISLLGREGQDPSSKSLKGTPGFMAPEYFLDRPQQYSYSIDVWAIGVILYYLIYLEYPYSSEKNGYKERINGGLPHIENQSSYSQTFSPMLKNQMKKFFKKYDSTVRKEDKREQVAEIYEYKYIHDFRRIQVTSSLKQKYEEYIMKLNSCHVTPLEKYILQGNCLYHEKALQVIHYPQWGYFFLLSNMKTIGYFNTESEQKVIRTYPDDHFSQKKDEQQVLYNTILKYVFKQHFSQFKDYLKEDNKIFAKRLDCTIDCLVKSNGSLAVKFKLELSPRAERLALKQNQIVKHTYQNYDQIEPNRNSNHQPINYNNNTFQVFFKPRTGTSSKQLKYQAYQTSIVFNNNMVNSQEVIVEESLSMGRDKYKMTKHRNAQSVLYWSPLGHRMITHVRQLLTIAATRMREEQPSFQSGYLITSN